MILELRKRISTEEFDYQALLDCLRGYERPRDKITALLRQGVIVRIKKGIYVFGPAYARRPYSREILANMIYGPSYVSLDYALHYHGLIPERVETLTSVSYGRSRRFQTPAGLFTYSMTPSAAYQEGIDRVALDQGAFLIATPEKALCDKIHHDRGAGLHSQAEIHSYLVENLRIDDQALAEFNAKAIDTIAERCRSRKMRLLGGLVRNLSRRLGKA
ncbi:MAG: hypothetical protein KA419_13920 [Acidobacteria bacterium]|nr:hypothetical protein [Acidobacteriota bacterium]